jgi:hypothetical protein
MSTAVATRLQKKPLKWGTTKHLQELIDDYFKTAKVPNVAGLCVKLDIHRDTWQYYATEKWKTKRKELDEEALQEIEDEREQAVLDDIMELEETGIDGEILIDGETENACYDTVKARVSVIFKKTQVRFEEFTVNEIFTAKNPAGSIFYAKSALGYRETAPEGDSGAKYNFPNMKVLIQVAAEKPANTIEQQKPMKVEVLQDDGERF